MKKISNKSLRLNKISISDFNTIRGGNTNNGVKPTHGCPEETEAETCTTSRTTVDFNNSNNTSC